MLLSLSRRLCWFVFLTVCAFIMVWAAGALCFDLPIHRLFGDLIAVLFAMTVAFFGIFGRGRIRMIPLFLTGLVAIWWFTLKPSNQRDWKPEVSQTAWAEIDGDEVTLHNVRNLDYRTVSDFTPAWETRTVRLSQLTGIDMAINYWGSPYMAHPIVSFQFADSPPLCFSIETRMEKGEAYSAIGGIYRQYELIYVVADERDVIRVRTNYRQGEDVYLYRLTLSAEKARGRFLEYVQTINQLKETPRWYNAITNNCTTSIRGQHDKAKRKSWDWRILVNGFGDEMLFEQGGIRSGGLPFSELKIQSRINEVAKAAGSDLDFSRLIRLNAPSFKAENPQY